MYSIVTSFNETYWNEIAKGNIYLMDSLWPKENTIYLYHQLSKIDKGLSNRAVWLDLYQHCPELLIFAEKWKDNPLANGAGEKKKAFRRNAIKFAHKTFAIWHAAKMQRTGWLIWIDCDAIVTKQVDDKFLKKICPSGKGICYLGRKAKYSECGFVAYNLDNPGTQKFLQDWEELYVSGEFINLSETHDSWTFDHIRKTFHDQSIFFNLNENAITDKNPFQNSLIGSHLAHAKGSDKAQTTNKIKKKLVK